MENFLLTIIITIPIIYFLYSLVIFWRTRVPFVATPAKLLNYIVNNIPIDGNTVLYDLGCGRGRFLFAAESKHPKKLVGYELSPLHVWYCRLKAQLTNSKVKIVSADIMTADISDATIIYLFMVPAIVQKAWKKITAETKPGTLVVTLADAIPGANLVKTVQLHPEKTKSSLLYFYEVK